MNEASRLRDQAIMAARSGDAVTATELFSQAIRAAPADASIMNSAANHFSRQGDKAKAIELLDLAVTADPEATEPLLNLALLLTGAGQPRHALGLLRSRQDRLKGLPRYWSIRAGAERSAGLKRESLSSYDQAATLDPSNARALEGRARMALETGRDAVAFYQAALTATPGAATALLGYGQALEASGEVEAARTLAERLVTRAPGWIDALEWLAQLRWSSGERGSFTEHYEAASTVAGATAAQLYFSWCRTLAGVDRFADAAEVAARARSALNDPPQFALLEAMHRGEAGDDERAEAIFSGLRLESVDRRVQEARHRLRRRELENAEALLSSAIEDAPDHVGAWALRDIGWRLSGDGRHEWLHGQPGLVAPIDMGLAPDQMAQLIELLDRLHDQSSMPVGQSVRDGTQTRGGLFDRHEPEIGTIEQGFRRAIKAYRDGLLSRDESHPLLRYRDSSWIFAGSWSIRVLGGGHHREHIHPQGLISSAAYFVVPQVAADPERKEGWLELGRPPPDLRLDLPPIWSIEPRPGICALFPSTLYHGTRPFAEGKRLTVAIDINLDRAE